MGIGQAISRVKESVRRAGLGGVVTGLGEQLRSAAIPPALRPAAQRLADLLTTAAPSDAAAQPVVSLTQAIAAHEANGASHAELAAAGGVCPFSGASAGLAGLLDASQFEAPAFEVVHTADAVEAIDAQIVESAASLPRAAAIESAGEVAAVESVPETAIPVPAAKLAKSNVRASARSVAKAPIEKKSAASVSSDKAPAKFGARVSDDKKSPARTSMKPVDRQAELAKPPANQKKSHPVSEKGVEKVAARPVSSKTPPRSMAPAPKGSRPAARRPVAKAAKKKTGL